MDWHILLTGTLIFVARICDVSIGTLRTIVTVQGRTLTAFFLCLVEVIIWITIIGTVVTKINESPILVLFYAFGAATGSVVGIKVERRLAFGMIVLRVITAVAGHSMAGRLRELGQAVTIFTGEGMRGPVTELYVVCRRRDLRWILPMVRFEDPNAFYITEQTRDVSKMLRPIFQPVTGWRAIFKMK